jgi:rubrerythrin
MGEGRPSSDPRPHERRDDADQLGGEPACWLPRVCPECGRLAEEEPPTRCESCGTAITPD